MTHIEQRTSTAAQWSAANPVLNRGEVGWESDTRKGKLGDGVTAWNALPYLVNGVSSVAGKSGAVSLVVADVAGAAPLISPTFTGTPTAPTRAPGSNTNGIANTAFVQQELAPVAQAVATRAPLADPVFTGDPRVPTPAVGDNDTTIANTAFVKAQGYAPLASPVFTGDPKAPTPATVDNDTSLATTAFVKAAVAAANSYTTYTPTLTGFSVSSSRLDFSTSGGKTVVHYRAVISSVGGQMVISLPVNAARVPASTLVLGQAHGSDISANAYALGAVYLNSVSTVSILSSAGVWGSAVPWTWAAGDLFSFTITYESVVV